ncbi:hypothetical protein [Chryseobacterium koreense]|uniref:hypothetical protein n=1 Tax=Chryseobacterium koreense TaxID=232216 RepID=UPI0026F0A463|nr:hypothetical protein [Chryseobacterium koreense]
MRVIILRGKSDCGKSTTLNLVYDELVSHPGVSASPKIILGNPSQRDFECIVTLKDTREIAFFTMGDYKNNIIDAVKKYGQQNVEILIIASNDEFQNHLDFICSNYPFNIINKSIPILLNSSTITVENFKDCGTILSLI